ncbi:MAG: hypothetical protein P1Q69_11645 [Candidatus Thorarchaeota archaeon]|nr:hypothetical protein [Candidatus Thorarchaeota archaeon]
MGFKKREVSEYETISKYDFQAIYSNLRRRANRMNAIPQPRKRQFIQRVGELSWHETEDGTTAWMLFPKKGGTKVIGALLDDLRSIYFRHGWYKTVIDPEQLSEEAEAAQSENWDRTPIVIVQVDVHDILYMETESENDDTEWSLMGVLEYGSPPKGNDFPVRWVRVSDPPPEVSVMLQGFQPSPVVGNIDSVRIDLLSKATSWSGNIREVTCHLTIDTEKEKYVVDIKERTKTIARKETEYTDEIVRFLRESLRTGEYLRIKDTYLKWDHASDVEYDEVELVMGQEKEWVHLSILKPLVHRYSFYPDSLQIPPTVSDLLKTTQSGDVLLKIDIDERLKNAGSKKYLRAQVKGVEDTSSLKNLEQERFGIFDVALLAECRQIVDLVSLKRYGVEVDVTGLAGLWIPPGIEEYSQFYDAITAEHESEDETELDEEENEDTFEEIVKAGPQLELARVDVEISSQRRKLDVVLQLFSVEEDFTEELVVFSTSSEIAKSQGIADTVLKSKIRSSLRAKRITEDEMDNILSRVCDRVEELGIPILEY